MRVNPKNRAGFSALESRCGWVLKLVVWMDNSSIAELFIREAESAEGHREQAFRRAAHANWYEEPIAQGEDAVGQLNLP